MILVVGASGYLGRETSRRLLAAGYRVRAASRSPESLVDLEALGAQPVRADLIDAESIRAACRGVDAVFAAAHSLMGRGRHASPHVDDAGHRTLIDAAKASGVRRFVYTSAMFASADHPVDFMRTKAGLERYLATSGLEFAILRPSAFMDFHVHEFVGKPIVESGKATLLGSGTNPVNFVAVADVAAMATAAILDREAHAVTIEVGGPDNVTRNELVAMYAQELRRRVTVRHVPLAVLRVAVPLVRPFQPGLARVLGMIVWSETSDQTFDLGSHPEPYARPVTHVRDFIASRVAAGAHADGVSSHAA